MRVALNGIDCDLADGATLADAVLLLDVRAGDRAVAAAVDGEIVRADRWARTPVRDGARIEVVRAAAGG